MPFGQTAGALFHKCDYCKAHSLKLPKTAIGLIALSVLACSASALIYLMPDHSRVHLGAGDDIESMNRSQLAAYEKLSTLEKANDPNVKLNNAAVVGFLKENIGTEVIVQMVRASPSNYDVSPKAIIALRDEKVDPAIIQAMIDASLIHSSPSGDDPNPKSADSLSAQDLDPGVVQATIDNRIPDRTGEDHGSSPR